MYAIRSYYGSRRSTIHLRTKNYSMPFPVFLLTNPKHLDRKSSPGPPAANISGFPWAASAMRLKSGATAGPISGRCRGNVITSYSIHYTKLYDLAFLLSTTAIVAMSVMNQANAATAGDLDKDSRQALQKLYNTEPVAKTLSHTAKAVSYNFV